MTPRRTFTIVPRLPEQLEPLRQMAYNLWWSWNHVAGDLFRRLDVHLWSEVGRNPVEMLARIDQARLETVARDDAFLAQLARATDAFYIYHNARTWFDERYAEHRNSVIAYFSAEFGIHESMPIYSGGLGVLAGDHLKSASDLGIPLIALGLMYRQGYFEQQLTEDGWQLENYRAYDFHNWPASLVLDQAGQDLKIVVHLGHEALTARIWEAHVGRVRLYLLDADVPENSPELRSVTARLYGGDARMRIRQEILLGIGGLRALRAMGIRPDVCHMNEGHAAFLALERVRMAIKEHGLAFREARELVASSNIFTTHTPVPAGIDRFDPKLVQEQLIWMPAELGISPEEFIDLGREEGGAGGASFCMPILALRMAYRSNGVSKLHGLVARRMWQTYWPDVPSEEIPLMHVTNGIHTRSWINPQMEDLFERYLGPGWAEAEVDDPIWNRIYDIPDAELWRVHVRRRERLVGIVRRRLREQLRRRGAPPVDVKAAEEALDPRALTIGFARRFAPYKRATLIFKNLDRLAALLRDPARPVQILFAGKAHPNDGAGKELIKMVAAVCNRPEFRRRVIFLENYDISLARILVQGVDVWLNNPLREHEASGTSGMKVPASGGLNISCLDGWWPEAHRGNNGWSIGDGRVYDDLAYQDHVESESLYNLLEREVVPMFYDQGDDELPRRWLKWVKDSMRSICPVFNTHRMVREYTQKMYLPTLRRERRLVSENFAITRTLAGWKDKLQRQWHQVRINSVQSETPQVLRVGDQLGLRAVVHLGSIDPADVAVEVYHGPVNPAGEFVTGASNPLRHVSGVNGEHIFEGTVPCDLSGEHGYAVRVVPNHPELAHRYDPGLIVWG